MQKVAVLSHSEFLPWRAGSNVGGPLQAGCGCVVCGTHRRPLSPPDGPGGVSALPSQMGDSTRAGGSTLRTLENVDAVASCRAAFEGFAQHLDLRRHLV